MTGKSIGRTAAFAIAWGVLCVCLAARQAVQGPIISSLWVLAPGLIFALAGAVSIHTHSTRPLKTACALVILHNATSLIMKLAALGRVEGHAGYASTCLAVIGLDSLRLMQSAGICIALLLWISRREALWVLYVMPAVLEIHRLVTMPSDLACLVSSSRGGTVSFWFELFGVLGALLSLLSIVAVILRLRPKIFAAGAYCLWAGQYALNIPLLVTLGVLKADWTSMCLWASIIIRLCIHASLLAVVITTAAASVEHCKVGMHSR